MTEATPFAMNYSDMHNPSVVSGGGAYAEYILPADNSMISTSIRTCQIMDHRWYAIWMAGTVIEMKSHHLLQTEM